MNLRDRIKELRRVKASELRPSPKNWRTHPDSQRNALRGALAEIGIAAAALVRELEDGSLELIDGHLRAEEIGGGQIPVLVLDVTAEEADKLLATIDPLASLAEADTKKLGELLAQVEIDNEALKDMLTDLGETWGVGGGTGDGGGEEGERPVIRHGACLADLAPSEEELVELRGKKILVEFSGGKDSSAAAIWVRHYLPDAEVDLTFVDMGADFPGFSFFLRDFAAWLGGRLVILRSTKNMFDVFLEHGEWPHFSFPYCHEVLHETLDNYVQAQPADGVIIVRGGRMQEKAARSKIRSTRWLVIDRLPNYRYFQPLYFGAKDACELILAEANAPMWSGYAEGLCRTACRICPGQRRKHYATMRKKFPRFYAELLEFERRFGVGAWQQKLSFNELADSGDIALAKGEEDAGDVVPEIGTGIEVVEVEPPAKPKRRKRVKRQ